MAASNMKGKNNGCPKLSPRTKFTRRKKPPREAPWRHEFYQVVRHTDYRLPSFAEPPVLLSALPHTSV